MRALFCDLDNTLIYSHRVALDADRLCVERLNGREQSYMTRRSFDFLSRARDFELTPVTTRSPEQYGRLAELARALGWRRALVCDGGMLLTDGAPDARWLEETRERAGDALRALSEALGLLRSACDSAHVHDAAGLMAYAVAEQPAMLAKRLRRRLDPSQLRVCSDRRKVYCIPRAIDKGEALRRYREREGVEFAAACGDSAFDLPMLEAADLAILPAGLAPRLRNPHRLLVPDGALLSDRLCALLESGEVFP